MDPIKQLSLDTTPDEQEAATNEGVYRYWAAEIEAADKREADFRKEGERIVKIFEGQKKEVFQFNILYSNIETLSPALYNATPRPEVRARERRPQPSAALAAQLGEGLLTYLLDDGSPRSETFSSAMKAAVTAGLVPGRGVTWITYDPILRKVAPPQPPTEGDKADAESEEVVEAQYICVEEVPWDEFRQGYAKTWKDVPWVARCVHMRKGEITKLVGAEKAAKVSFNAESDEPGERDSQHQTEKTAAVYQIWDRSRKQVVYWTASYKDGPLQVLEDPYQLSGFFPCPPPLRFVERLSNLTPVAQYTMYEEQAKELNAITLRINRIVRALKVRGGYDANVGDEVKKILTADDNEMIALQNVAALSAQGVSLDKAIWLMPIEMLVAVLQQLYIAREQCKQTIYEIMGVSDIVRGATVASESATAQNLKDKWTGVRIKRPQHTVQDYVRDALRLMLELAVTHVDPDTLYRMSGTEAPRKADLEKQAMVLMQQMPTMPPEGIQQAQQQLQQLQSAPNFDDSLALLQDDVQRSFVVDIETNSTIDAEATEDKQDISELLTAMGGFLAAVGPMVQQGILPFEAAQAMMLAITRRFRFGRQVEDYIKQMQPPQPQGDPQAQKDLAKLEEEKLKFEFEKKVAEKEMDFREKEMEMNAKFLEREIQMGAKEAEQNLKFKEQAAQQNIAAKAGQAQLQIAGKSQQATLKNQGEQQKLKLQQQAGGPGTSPRAAGSPAPAQAPATSAPASPDNSAAILEAVTRLESLIQSLQSALTAPRTGQAVKLPDGSWKMVSTPSQTLQ